MISLSAILPDITRLAGRVWQRNFTVWLRYVRPSLVGNLGEPILFLLALGYGVGHFIQEVEGGTYLAFIAPGILASSAMNTAAFECTFSSFTRMTVQNTYRAIISTPVSLDEVVAGEILWGATKSLVSGLVMLCVFAVIGLLTTPLVLLLPLLVFLTGMLFASLSMIATALSPSYDFFNYYFTLVITPMFLFSGVFFPLDTLPEWAGLLASMIPLTHAVDLCRSVMRGELAWSLLLDLLWIVGFTTAAFLAATVLIRRRLIK